MEKDIRVINPTTERHDKGDKISDSYVIKVDSNDYQSLKVPCK